MLRDGGTETQSVTFLFFSVLFSESLFYFLCQHSLSLKYTATFSCFIQPQLMGTFSFFFLPFSHLSFCPLWFIRLFFCSCLNHHSVYRSFLL